ncbi:MAG: hypothetical protein M1817_000784 [Caeruleum heppii]|nr:MAG: hypothetical protein M1817_000784 [Caeruleum heppii]
MAEVLPGPRAADFATFPFYAAGDLYIMMAGIEVYQLHMNVIRHKSTILKELLMVKLEDIPQNGTGPVVHVGTHPNSRVVLASLGPIIALMIKFTPDEEFTNHRDACCEVARHYDNLFRAFYRETITIGNHPGLSLLEDCVGLLGVAQGLGSLTAIAGFVNEQLLSHGQALFRAIGQDPIGWSHVACDLRSGTIYRECVVHLVGMWDAIMAEDQARLRPETIALCRVKVRALHLHKQAVEATLAGHYPMQALATYETTSTDEHAEIAPHVWVVLALFRQWFATALAEGRGHHGLNGGLVLYRQIRDGGEAYLGDGTLREFYGEINMTPLAVVAFEATLAKYKEELKPLVARVVKHNLQLDVTGEEGELPYFTCGEVIEADLPWLGAEIEAPNGTAVPDVTTQP